MSRINLLRFAELAMQGVVDLFCILAELVCRGYAQIVDLVEDELEAFAAGSLRRACLPCA